MDRLNRPLLIVLSAPSGAGKSTLCGRLLERFEGLAYSVSCTTRAPRGRERDGRDYRFLSEAQFQAFIQAGAFLEHARVHGHWYGTLKQTVLERLQAGESVVLDIDVQGADQIRQALAAAEPDLQALRTAYVDIFIAPPGLDTLRRRLESRNEDRPAVIEQRLARAAAELACQDRYRYRVVNDCLEQATAELIAILKREAARQWEEA